MSYLHKELKTEAKTGHVVKNYFFCIIILKKVHKDHERYFSTVHSLTTNSMGLGKSILH